MDEHKKGGAVFLESNSESNEQVEEETVEQKEVFTPEKDNVVYCESCEFVKSKTESNWFPGDACPSCKNDYLSGD